jgi:hypothetical protein
MKRKLRRKLAIVWALTTRPEAGKPVLKPHNRYVAKAFTGDCPAWGVFDRMAERFLSDNEVIGLADDTLRTATVLQ